MTARDPRQGVERPGDGRDTAGPSETFGFIYRAPGRHPILAALLFSVVVASGLTAEATLSRSHDERLAIAGGCVLAATFIAFLGAAAADWWTGLLVEPWQVSQKLGVEILGEIEADLMGRIVVEFSPRFFEGQPAPAMPEGPAPGQQTALVKALLPPVQASTQPPDGMATSAQLDGFRALRDRLMLTAADQRLARFTTLVVPLVSGSGGSYVARNLAASFTFQDGGNALLIDCNLVNPTQHLALRASDEGGLFSFLDEPTVSFTPKPTGIPNLHLIPAGRPRSQYREYFSSNRMRSLMRVIRESGAFVFLDGPHTKGALDARILSELADLVVLVVGYGKGTPEDIAQAVAMFEPTKFAGVVFNERV
jgi:protein-tyrosine kinase